MPQYVGPQPKPIHNPAFSAHPPGKSNTLSFIFQTIAVFQVRDGIEKPGGLLNNGFI